MTASSSASGSVAAKKTNPIAQAAKTFYAGKTLTVYIPFSVGGSSDTTGRAFAALLPTFIPGHPTIVVKNLPGGGGTTAMQEVSEVLPADGMSTVVSNAAIPLRVLLKQPGTNFPMGQMPIVGADRSALIIVARTADGTSIKALRALSQSRPLTIGQTAAGGVGQIGAVLGLKLLGITNVKAVYGFSSAGAPIALAMQQGAIDVSSPADAGFADSYEPLVKSHTIKSWFQTGLLINNDLVPDPSLRQYGKIPTIKQLYQSLHQGHSPSGGTWVGMKQLSAILQLGEAFFMRPGTSPVALYALREAFKAMLSNKNAIRQLTPIVGATPIALSWQSAQSLVDHILKLPQSEASLMASASGITLG